MKTLTTFGLLIALGSMTACAVDAGDTGDTGSDDGMPERTAETTEEMKAGCAETYSSGYDVGGWWHKTEYYCGNNCTTQVCDGTGCHFHDFCMNN